VISNGNIADVSVGGAILRLVFRWLKMLRFGDYILLHTGFAIQKISEDEALELFRLLNEIEDAMKKLTAE